MGMALENDATPCYLQTSCCRRAVEPRDDIGELLTQKADSLRDQLSRLGGDVSKALKGRRGPVARRKAAIKLRDKWANTWAGRAAQPICLREKIRAGAKRRGLCGYYARHRIREGPQDPKLKAVPRLIVQNVVCSG